MNVTFDGIWTEDRNRCEVDNITNHKFMYHELTHTPPRFARVPSPLQKTPYPYININTMHVVRSHCDHTIQ